MRDVIEQRPLARIDYISIVHPDTLQDVEAIEGKASAALAVLLGQARLIDNDFLP